MTDLRRAQPYGTLPARTGLARFTPARVGLASSGSAIATPDQLRFQLDHALARDAVHARLDVPAMLAGLRQRAFDYLALHSAVPRDDRQTYLRRPDLGRRLDPASVDALHAAAVACPENALSVVLGDGLSALAVDRHALPLLDALAPLLAHWRLGPVCVVSQARVAVADEIGERLRARATVILIGERPGLSSADSLGAYITWQPRIGRTDAERNCVSNIRDEGLSYPEAARRIAFYLEGAQRLGASGVALKESAALLPGADLV